MNIKYTEEEMMHFIEMDFDRYEVEKCLRTRKLTNR